MEMILVNDCLFCQISRGEIPAYKIYEDDLVLAFLDIHPNSNGHTLIIPKKHFHDFTDLDQETLLHIYEIAKKLTTYLEEKLPTTGLSLVTNYHDLQEVKHFHLHLIPRRDGAIKDIEEVYNLLKP